MGYIVPIPPGIQVITIMGQLGISSCACWLSSWSIGDDVGWAVVVPRRAFSGLISRLVFILDQYSSQYPFLSGCKCLINPTWISKCTWPCQLEFHKELWQTQVLWTTQCCPRHCPVCVPLTQPSGLNSMYSCLTVSIFNRSLSHSIAFKAICIFNNRFFPG